MLYGANMQYNKYYIPVLRWKAAEWSALSDLDEYQKDFIIPLVEPTPDRFNDEIDKVFTNTFKRLKTSWKGRDVFIDFILLDEVKSSAILNKIESSEIFNMIPVVNIKSSKSYMSMFKILVNSKNRVCIRISLEDLLHPNLKNKIDDIIHYFRLSPSEIDLIIDYKIIDNSYPEYNVILKKIPYPQDWNTLTFLSGSFPIDLRDFSPGEHLHPRLEWLKWHEEISSNRLIRRPGFGDYTIQHPIFHAPPSFVSPSASIRYTSTKDWLIMRGESVKKKGGGGYGQYLGNALLLSARDEFCGSDFSAGDRYIYQKGQQLEKSGNLEKPGNATDWLQAGINHHITFVIHQLSNLPDS